MNRNYHSGPIAREQRREHLIDILRRGAYTLIDTVIGRTLGIALLVLLVIGWAFRVPISAWAYTGALSSMAMGLYTVVYLPMVLAAVTLLLVVLARPWFHDRVARNLIRAGLINKAGEPPILLRRRPADEYTNCTIWEFRTCGIPLALWLEKQAEIQSVLNVNITEAREGKDQQNILLYTVPATVSLHENKFWDDRLIDEDDSIIVLGCGYLGDVKVDIDVLPHFLIGGSTGSGKSILLKTILWQAIRRQEVVHIADFKGGVDFSKGWHQLTNIITEEEALLAVLEDAIKELGKRKKLFLKAEVSKITEYREKTGANMKRIFIGCDEVAELLDKTGADSTRKALLAKIESALSTIARQGRAFGFHLVLCTQRPSADVVPGSIKSVVDVRICGRADATLSTIILGDGRAHEMIPKHIPGRFMLDGGTVFQGYNFTY